MLIIRRLNCIDAVSGIVTLSKWPSGARVITDVVSVIAAYVAITLTTSVTTRAPDGHLLRVTIPDAASIQLNLLMMSI